MSKKAEEFRKALKKSLKKNREAFEGMYKDEIDSLLGLSREEIDKITPDITDLQTYDELTTIVKEASRRNVSQAELKEQIQELGDIAVKIATKVPSLAKLFL